MNGYESLATLLAVVVAIASSYRLGVEPHRMPLRYEKQTRAANVLALRQRWTLKRRRSMTDWDRYQLDKQFIHDSRALRVATVAPNPSAARRLAFSLTAWAVVFACSVVIAVPGLTAMVKEPGSQSAPSDGEMTTAEISDWAVKTYGLAPNTDMSSFVNDDVFDLIGQVLFRSAATGEVVKLSDGGNRIIQVEFIRVGDRYALIHEGQELAHAR